MRWYAEWLRLCKDSGRSPISLEERVRTAVDRTGARRGLARRTRQTYMGQVGRYARWTGGGNDAVGARALMEPERALSQRDGAADCRMAGHHCLLRQRSTTEQFC
jgi:hypothetical protein